MQAIVANEEPLLFASPNNYTSHTFKVSNSRRLTLLTNATTKTQREQHHHHHHHQLVKYDTSNIIPDWLLKSEEWKLVKGLHIYIYSSMFGYNCRHY